MVASPGSYGALEGEQVSQRSLVAYDPPVPLVPELHVRATMRRSHVLICLAALGGSWAEFDQQCARPTGAWASFCQVVAEPPCSLCVHPRECANA